MKPVVGITMGDPLGVGPEIILKALPKFRDRATFRVFGDPFFLKDLPKEELVGVTDISPEVPLQPKEAGEVSVIYLDRAMVAYEVREIQCLVTAPISKTHVHLAGFPFPGHTEYLAHRTNCEKFVMMMAGPRLKVSLVTIHEPLADVPKLLSIPKICETIEITYRSLEKDFGINNPRIAVCGLNPHAGESGNLGMEEIEMVKPAIVRSCEKGYRCEGPMVPDAVFHEAYEGKWDAIVCMYHDQGLIPFKMIHFSDGVNVTLGLPLVRTSPDHGTAFDIAGKGIADSSSMEAAIELAIKMLGCKEK